MLKGTPCPLHPLPRCIALDHMYMDMDMDMYMSKRTTHRTAIMLPLSITLKPSRYLPSSSDSTSAATSGSVSCICLGTQVRGTTDSV